MVVKINGVSPKQKTYGGHLGAPVKKEVMATISQEKTVNKEVVLAGQTQEKVKQVTVPADFARVKVMGGRTVQTAPFESLRVDVSLELPCAKDDIDATYEFAGQWVIERLEAAVKGA